MKTYEQLYKEALERARTWKEKSGMPEDKQGILDDIFPELKKTKDELIKEELIHFLKTCRDPRFVGSRKQDEWIEWLEKQGKTALDPINEEKADNTNKVEPRFKTGDWVVNNVGTVNQIVSDWTDGYTLDNHVYLSDHWANNHYRFWNIQDAKDGDILVASDGSIFIFKEIVGCGCKHYIALEKDNETINVNNNLKHFWETASGVKPASREQCDLLFQKMKKAGYEWDATTKKLKVHYIKEI